MVANPDYRCWQNCWLCCCANTELRADWRTRVTSNWAGKRGSTQAKSRIYPLLSISILPSERLNWTTGWRTNKENISTTMCNGLIKYSLLVLMTTEIQVLVLVLSKSVFPNFAKWKLDGASSVQDFPAPSQHPKVLHDDLSFSHSLTYSDSIGAI